MTISGSYNNIIIMNLSTFFVEISSRFYLHVSDFLYVDSGYMSPEYALDGYVSTKSDVFSFGVVLLEIISGKRNTGFYRSKEISSLLCYACSTLCIQFLFSTINVFLFRDLHLITRLGDYGERINC